MKPIDKAAAARRLKENEDFKAIMECVNEDIFALFQTTKLGDTEALQTVHALSHGYKLLNTRIDKYIEMGNFEVRKDENS